jgi:hypothetical protein
MEPVVFETKTARRDARQNVDEMSDELEKEPVRKGKYRAKANNNNARPMSWGGELTGSVVEVAQRRPSPFEFCGAGWPRRPLAARPAPMTNLDC